MKRARVPLLALGVVTIGACNQILGTPDPALCRVGLALPDGACSSCVAEKCCAEASACAAHPGCRDYEACALGCGSDYGCRAACLAKQPITTDGDLAALDHCVVTSCEAPCGLSCGVPVSPQQPDVAQACQDCVTKRACDPAETCGASLGGTTSTVKVFARAGTISLVQAFPTP